MRHHHIPTLSTLYKKNLLFLIAPFQINHTYKRTPDSILSFLTSFFLFKANYV